MTAYFHTPNGTRDELEEAGFTDVKLIAVEGFANALNTDELARDTELSPYVSLSGGDLSISLFITVPLSIPNIMNEEKHYAGTKLYSPKPGSR